jgi:hypothetical protein
MMLEWIRGGLIVCLLPGLAMPAIAAVFTADATLNTFVDPRTASSRQLTFPGLDARQVQGVGVVRTTFDLHTPDPPPLGGSGSLDRDRSSVRTSAGFMINACLMMTTATAVWQSPRYAKPDPKIRVSVGPGTTAEDDITKTEARVVAAPFLSPSKGELATQPDGVTPLRWEDNVAILKLDSNLGAKYGFTRVQGDPVSERMGDQSQPAAVFAYWPDSAADFASWPDALAPWRLVGHSACTLRSLKDSPFYTTDCSLIPGIAGAPVFARVDVGGGQTAVAAVAIMVAEAIAADARSDERKLMEPLSDINHNIAIPIPERINGQTLAQIIEANPCSNGGAAPAAVPPKVSPSLTLESFGGAPWFGALWGPNGQIEDCREEACWQRKYGEFIELLLRFEEAAAQPAPVPPARRALPKVGDFYESRVGVLIHEECFDQYPFDIEQAVVESVVQGFQCMMDASVGDGIYRSHIPRLVNLFSAQNYTVATPRYNHLGSLVGIDNPCDPSQFSEYETRPTFHLDCQFIPEVQLGRPKIICQNEQAYMVASDGKRDMDPRTTEDAAYATLYQNITPAYVNYRENTRIYNPPFIAISERSPERRMPFGHFKATVWHELTHNLGYSHTHSTPDYAYMCEVGCFAKEYGGAISQELSDSAFQQCAQHSSGFAAPEIFNESIKILAHIRKYSVIESGGLKWSPRDIGPLLDLEGANRYCAAQPLPGTNWRLPTITELEQLYEGGSQTSYCGAVVCTVPPGFKLSHPFVWSRDLNGSEDAWVMNFVNGERRSYDVGVKQAVLCVSELP